MSRSIALTGDPELDASIPIWPRVLPEISWVPLSPTKVLAAGSLGATLLPSRLGETSLLDLLSRLDGRSTLAALIGGDDKRHEDHRRYLRLLFRAGLIEETCDTPSTASSFHALTMDQTRVHRDRREALHSSQRPILVAGAAPALIRALKATGLRICHEEDVPEIALQLLVLDPDGVPRNAAWSHRSLPVLPVRIHGGVLDIGPWLAPRGGCSLADLQRHIAREAVAADPSAPVDPPLLDALCAHTVSLIVARASPITIASTLYRVRVTAEGPVSERIAVSSLLNALHDAPQALKARLTARAEGAMPALRHVGTKSHESHHAPRNLLAALEIQESGLDPLSVLPGLGAHASARIGRLLASTFGYTQTADAKPRRNCPTGGNLGSPEPLLWVAADGLFQVYRYLPLPRQLECVARAPANSRGRPEAGVICLGNREKMSRKYGKFADTLVRLDGGVARAFFTQAANAEGIRLSPISEFKIIHPSLTELVCARDYYYTPLWGFQLALGSPLAAFRPWKLYARHHFLHALAARRSQRVFEAAGVSAERYARAVVATRPAAWRGLEMSLLAEIKPVLRVRSDGRQRLYRIHGDARLEALSAAFDGPEMFLQRSLDQAPFALFFVASLAPLLQRHGEAALDALLLLAGEWVGKLWLSLADLGLGGCACGAAVEGDLQGRLPPPYADDDLLVSIVSGRVSR